MPSNGNAARNGRRQPQELKLSGGSSDTARNAPDESRVAIGEPICGMAAYRPRCSFGAC